MKGVHIFTLSVEYSLVLLGAFVKTQGRSSPGTMNGKFAAYCFIDNLSVEVKIVTFCDFQGICK